MYFLVMCLMLVGSVEITASDNFIEIPESINDSVALISISRNELKTLSCKWPGSSGNQLHSLVFSNEKITLNMSRGGNLTITTSTTCKLSGRYVCQSLLDTGKIEVGRKLDLLVTNCNPIVHPERDINRTIPAMPGTDLHVNYRVTVAMNSPNYPRLNVHGRYLTTSTADEKFNFNFDPVSSIDYRMRLTVKKLTQEDYGLTVINLNTGVNAGVRLKLFISPPGRLNRTFNYISDTTTLICKSSWYPKSVTISKALNSHENLIMSLIDNTLHRKETVQIQAVLPDSGSCTDIGTYKCTLTDFKGNSDIIKSFVPIDNCTPLLCEPLVDPIDVKVNLNTTASLTMCIKGPLTLDLSNMSVSIQRDGTELQSSRYTADVFRRDESKLYHYLRLNVSDVQSYDQGIYAVNVTFTSRVQIFSVHFNVIVEIAPVLCNNTYNNTIYNATIGQNETIKICVQTSASVAMVEINKKRVEISDAPPDDLRADLVYVDQTVPGFLFLHKHLSRIAVQTLKTYSVKVWFKSGYTLTYTFRLKIIGKLEPCEGETNIKVVEVQLGSNAVAHLCVTSDLGPFREIGVNGQVTCVNKFDRARDAVGVTSHLKDDSTVTDHYIQLYVQNVSSETPLTYDVLIRPTNVYFLNISVQLKILNDSQHPRRCNDRLTKTYIMASRSDPVTTTEICVLATGKVKSIRVNGRDKYPGSMNVSYRTHQVNGSRDESVGEHSLREHVVDIQMWNITVDNFSRYDIDISFDTNLTWTHVFYLLDKKDSKRCPSLNCPGGANSYSEGQLTLCVAAYGEMDGQINANGQLYEVENQYPSRKNSIHYEENLKCLRYRALLVDGAPIPSIKVFGEWDHNIQRYIILKFSQQDSRMLQNVTMVTSGIVYTFGTKETPDLSTQLLSSSLVLMESMLPPLDSLMPLIPNSSVLMESTLQLLEVKSPRPESEHSTMVLAAVVISVVAFVAFSITVCVFVFKGSRTSSSVSRIKRSSNVSAAYQRESREISRLLNSTLSSQGTERCLLNLSDYQPSTPSRNTSATYSTLSADYITPLDF